MVTVGASQIEEPGERASPTTILALFWSFATFIWSIFTPPQYTFPARVLLLQPLWILRVLFNDDAWVQDLLIFLVLHAGFTLWSGAWSLPSLATLVHYVPSDLILLYLKVFSALAGCGFLAGGIVYRGQQLEREAREEAEPIKRIDENPLPPLLIPSRTTHSRLFPQKHSFSYSYLFVGVPVGVKGRFGKALSIDTDKHGWFHVDAADHLSRGEHGKNLAEKLASYLATQGVRDSDYEFAYLVTAPRFLGYNFNPVSFWYIYDESLELKYMIPEVNNTFGERRVYLLTPSTKADQELNQYEGVTQANGFAAKTTSFTQSWGKDFHVSPFNSRQGSYSIRTIDPLATSVVRNGTRFDTTIVLRSSEDHPKIIARVFSEGNTLDPASVGTLGLLRFIASWWWVGLMTLPRILWEAQKLYFAKRLQLYFRPEVTRVSIGRAYTSDEEKLETFFRAFLGDVVEEAREPFRLIYEPPHCDNEIVFYSRNHASKDCDTRTLTLKVISPAFYSRFVHYAHAQEALDRESLATDEQNRTAVVEPASLVPAFLGAVKYRQQRITRVPSAPGIRWRLMTYLRCPAAGQSFQTSMPPTKHYIEDIRRFGPSELDTFARLRCEDPGVYRRIVTELFLAQRFCLGMPVVLDALDFALRVVVVLVAMILIEGADHFDILRPRPHTADDIWPVMLMLTFANATHLWALFKG